MELFRNSGVKRKLTYLSSAKIKFAQFFAEAVKKNNKK